MREEFEKFCNTSWDGIICGEEASFKAGWNAALEKAAETAYECLDDPYLSGHGYATSTAEAIRALKEK